MFEPVVFILSAQKTGPLHAGSLRTCLFNYLFAKKYNGDFILRIEDTDKKREISGAEKYIIDSLAWLGMTIDESPIYEGKFGPYRQSERLELYKKYALILIESRFAYYAFDTDSELKAMREVLEKSGMKNTGYSYLIRPRMKNSTVLSADEVKKRLDAGDPYVIRFKMPRNLDVVFKDTIRGAVSFNTSTLDDKILFKSDGFPAYHLASVVDDHLMEISHVIRAEEWVSSTPLHMLLYEALGWDKPVFAHLPLVLGPDGKKLSKRHAAKYGFPIFPLDWKYTGEDGNEVSILGFKEAGYIPEALVNFIALIGWNPGGTNKEIMTINEMIALFDIEKVSKGGAIFDFDKLKNFNSIYLRSKSYEELSKLLPDNGRIYTGDKLHKIVDIAKERAVFESELYGKASYFFEDVIIPEETVAKHYDEFFKFCKFFLEEMRIVDFMSEETLKIKVTNICDALGIKTGKVMPDLRMALTGGKPGSELPLTMWILGEDRTEKRLINYLTIIEKNNVETTNLQSK